MYLLLKLSPVFLKPSLLFTKKFMGDNIQISQLQIPFCVNNCINLDYDFLNEGEDSFYIRFIDFYK